MGRSNTQNVSLMEGNLERRHYLLILLLLLVTSSRCSGSSCNRYYHMEPGTSGIMASPNYPFNYTDGLMCHYSISAMNLDPPDPLEPYYFCFTFHRFELEECNMGHQRWDYLQFSLANGNSFSYCGRGQLYHSTEKEDNIWQICVEQYTAVLGLKFMSDAYINAPGFYATFTIGGDAVIPKSAIILSDLTETGVKYKNGDKKTGVKALNEGSRHTNENVENEGIQDYKVKDVMFSTKASDEERQHDRKNEENYIIPESKVKQKDSLEIQELQNNTDHIITEHINATNSEDNKKQSRLTSTTQEFKANKLRSDAVQMLFDDSTQNLCPDMSNCTLGCDEYYRQDCYGCDMCECERTAPCEDEEWSCFSSRQCISLSMLCDGTFDCCDYSDESYAHARCFPGQHPGAEACDFGDFERGITIQECSFSPSPLDGWELDDKSFDDRYGPTQDHTNISPGGK